MKKIILPVSITLISILLIGCAQTAPQDTPAPEETATHEPVLLLCSVCDEMKVEDEHCHDWQAEMIERNNAERAERERQAEIDAANEAAYEAARLEAWNTLPEDEREEWMAQARADAMQWWEDLIQEEYDVMIATGGCFHHMARAFIKQHHRQSTLNLPASPMIMEHMKDFGCEYCLSYSHLITE